MPTAISIEEELQRLTAEAIWNARGTVAKGVVLQMVPEYSPEIGELAHGERKYPFWSVCCVIPDRTLEGASFGTMCRMERTISAILVADRLVVEQLPSMWAYKEHRESIFRALNKRRFTASFVSDPNSYLHYGVARSRSAVETASWFDRSTYVAALDIIYTTDETP